MILRSIVSVDSHIYTYNKLFTMPVYMRIVNDIFLVPDQQLMISIPNSKNTDQTVHLQRLIKHSRTFSHDAAQLNTYYVLWPQEFSLSQVSDKVVMVICYLASNSKRKEKALIELEKS